jgi:hypothetical protein
MIPRQVVRPKNEVVERVFQGGTSVFRVTLPLPTSTVTARFVCADVGKHSALESRDLPNGVAFKVVVADPPWGLMKHTGADVVSLVHISVGFCLQRVYVLKQLCQQAMCDKDWDKEAVDPRRFVEALTDLTLHKIIDKEHSVVVLLNEDNVSYYVKALREAGYVKLQNLVAVHDQPPQFKTGSFMSWAKTHVLICSSSDRRASLSLSHEDHSLMVSSCWTRSTESV